MQRNDIDRLTEYRDKVIELHELSKQSGVKLQTKGFDNLIIQLPQNTKVTQTSYNDDNCISVVRTFTLAQLEDEIGRIVEKIKYRKKMLAEKAPIKVRKT